MEEVPSAIRPFIDENRVGRRLAFFTFWNGATRRRVSACQLCEKKKKQRKRKPTVKLNETHLQNLDETRGNLAENPFSVPAKKKDQQKNNKKDVVQFVDAVRLE